MKKIKKKKNNLESIQKIIKILKPHVFCINAVQSNPTGQLLSSQRVMQSSSPVSLFPHFLSVNEGSLPPLHNCNYKQCEEDDDDDHKYSWMHVIYGHRNLLSTAIHIYGDKPPSLPLNHNTRKRIYFSLINWSLGIKFTAKSKNAFIQEELKDY